MKENVEKPGKKKNRSKIFTWLIIIGAACLCIAGGITASNFYTEFRAKKNAAEISAKVQEQISGEDKDNSYVVNPDVPMKVVWVDGVPYVGNLEIPNLDLKLPIIAECTDANLKIAPCRYEDTTPYKEHFIIAGHNYSAHFGRLVGADYKSKVIFTDVDDNVFEYEIGDVETMRPTEIERMDTGAWSLTLFTCDYSGRARVAVRCYAVDY